MLAVGKLTICLHAVRVGSAQVHVVGELCLLFVPDSTASHSGDPSLFQRLWLVSGIFNTGAVGTSVFTLC